MSKTEKAAELSGFGVDVGELSGLDTQFDVFRFMKKLTEFYDFRTFMVLNLPPPTAMELAGNTIITNWPAELTALFDREGLGKTSFVLQHLRRSTLPFIFDLENDRPAESNANLREIFGRFGIARGAYFPVHDATGKRGAIAFGGTRPVPSVQQMMELMYVSAHVYERLADFRKADIRPGEVLTERETDCLNWTAAGKTSAEIADILGLSEHTVNHYLNRAAKKLDTVNRTQAVAKALRVGLIK
ncbi:DNA-binding transcriptional regulator, CsgD family [Rhizobium sp. NFR07]|uniref:helix-turn-helix transcriptional regulator n=1 Tax=Rhizobium sp. NFR07 TaxID=1566262 RepID=UPI0008F20F3A|nr:autoinducer binding domain-containing protein [Rhizobium sp. NFR07]SFB07788.1 DNA-binding transcriptional regulator, CsgD family [Rhizobium sp. NFR07]